MFRQPLVRSLVLHYLRQFDYDGPRVRVLTTPTRALQELDRKRCKSDADDRETRDWMGWTVRFPRSTVIYVNVAAHDTLGQLLDTCAHEALHAARWVGHPTGFDAEVAETVLA